MARNIRVALRPKSEATRPTHAVVKRVTTNVITCNDDANITAALRVQYLAARYGLLGAHAALIAALAFEGAHGHG